MSSSSILLFSDLRNSSHPPTHQSHSPTNMATPAYPLFCMGNPLLDIQVNANEELLAK